MTIIARLKYFFSILLTVVLLVACNTTLKVSDNGKEINNTLSGTIIFLQSFPDQYLTETLISQYQEIFAEYTEKFTELYPKVKIIMELTEEGKLVEELARKLEKGLGPDLIYSQSIHILPLIQAKVLLPVDQDSINLSQFRSEAIAQVLYKNQIYGIPLGLATQALCYNRKKVKELPKTLSELIVQARQGYSVGMLSSFEDAFWGTHIFGGELLDAQGRMILDQGEGWVRWINWLKSANNEPNFILNEDPFVLQNALIEEKLAYSTCWSSQIPFLRASLSPEQFGVTLLPGENNKQAAPFLVADTLLFSSASSPNQAKIALRFAQFLANPQQQTEIAVKLRSIIPANKDAMIDPRLFPIQGIIQKQSQNVTTFSLDQMEKLNIMTNLARDFYIKVMAGEMSPEQAARQLTQTFNSQFEVP
ncbi:MAG: extracellular solute-binding protein [Cyanobacteria bacterium J06592_8]